MKIIGSDYDGTLTHGGIGEEKLSAIKKWQSMGNLFGIVSGRGISFLDTLSQTFPSLNLDFFVACNGGFITDGKGKLIHETRCSTLPLVPFAKTLFSWGCKYIHLNSNRYTCLVEDIDDTPDYISKDQACLMKNLPPVDYFNQVSLQLSSLEESARLTQKIAEIYGEWVTPLQNGICIDIVPVGVNKANGLYRIMEFFVCEYKDVITVGDNHNDADMIREFRSYAMESGVQEIKALANDTVNDVIELIEKELKLG